MHTEDAGNVVIKHFLKYIFFAGFLTGNLLVLFDAAYWIWGLLAATGYHLAVAGTGALFVINLGLTAVFFVMAVRRVWPSDWYAYIDPATQPQTWAMVLLGIWLSSVVMFVLLGLAAQERLMTRLSLQERLWPFLVRWLGGLGTGGLLTWVWLLMTASL